MYNSSSAPLLKYSLAPVCRFALRPVCPMFRQNYPEEWMGLLGESQVWRGRCSHHALALPVPLCQDTLQPSYGVVWLELPGEKNRHPAVEEASPFKTHSSLKGTNEALQDFKSTPFKSPPMEAWKSAHSSPLLNAYWLGDRLIAEMVVMAHSACV